MIDRRAFIGASAIVATSLAFTPGEVSAQVPAPRAFLSQRPPPEKRRFTSPAFEKKILEVQAQLKDPELAWMFANCFPNTLDTTVTVGEPDGRPDTYVITGDINAMWLRDSSALVWPYLPFVRKDPALARLITGVITRHARCVLLDPYANAFPTCRACCRPLIYKPSRRRMCPGFGTRENSCSPLTPTAST